MHIRSDKINRYIKIYDGIRYLVLYDCKRHTAIYGRIKYPLSEKISIIDSINHSFPRIRIDSYNSLPKEKILTFHNFMILIKSVF